MTSVLFLLFSVGLVVAFFGSLAWIYRDAEARAKPGILVALLAAFIAWPISLLVWIALRPPVEPPGRRPFNLEDFRQQ